MIIDDHIQGLKVLPLLLLYIGVLSRAIFTDIVHYPLYHVDDVIKVIINYDIN